MRLLFILSIMLFSFSAPVMAENARMTKALQRLEEINSYRPEQSSKHERSKDVLDNRVLDKTNRVVGEVNDVILTRNGSISSLNVNFNRMKLRTSSLYINYSDLGVRPVSNGYKMSYTDDQVAAIVPDILANIETASGKNADTYSTRKIIGRNIYSKNGRKLGKVKDILFDAKGHRAEMLYIVMGYKSVRGEKMAIPFSQASYEGSKINVKDSFADAMIAYAKQ